MHQQCPNIVSQSDVSSVPALSGGEAPPSAQTPIPSANEANEPERMEIRPQSGAPSGQSASAGPAAQDSAA